MGLELGQELKVKGLAKKNKVVQNIQNSIKCETDETPEIPTVFEELESELISQDTYDPGVLDEPIDYEDHISLDRTELDHELGDQVSVREKLLDPSITLTFSQEKLDQNRFLSHLLSIMRKTSLKGPKGFQWSCLVCGKVYPQRNHLQEHVESKHVKGVVHTCSLCSQEFTQSKHLKFHVKTFHENIYNKIGNQSIWQFAGVGTSELDLDQTNNDVPLAIIQEEPPCKMARFQENDS